MQRSKNEVSIAIVLEDMVTGKYKVILPPSCVKVQQQRQYYILFRLFEKKHNKTRPMTPNCDKKTPILLVCLFNLIWLFTAKAQMDQWILFPNQIDFQTGLVTAFSETPAPYKVENAVFRNGQLLFYLRNGSVIGPDGSDIGSFSGNTTAMLKEFALSPKPGDCGTWFIFWLEKTGSQFHAFFREIIWEEAGIVLGQTGELLPGPQSGNSGGLAVSPILPGIATDRDLYLVAPEGIWRYHISLSGIAFDEYIEAETGGEDFIAEADLSPDGQWLAWGNGNQVFSMKTTPPHTLHSLAVGNQEGKITGLEFKGNGAEIFLSHSQLGLRKWKPGNASHSAVWWGQDYRRTQLERGADGRTYGVRDDGKLGQISKLGFARKSSFDLNAHSIIGLPELPFWYSLPDQIDGEDYDLFTGTLLSSGQFTLNGMDVSNFSVPPTLFYNCDPIKLETSWTGDPESYALHIFSIHPEVGSQVSGSSFTNYYFQADGPPPAEIDLRCLDNELCELFDMSVHAGYFTFAVTMTIKNRCDSLSRTGYFRIFDEPGQANLEIADGTGFTCPASHDIASPCPMGLYSTHFVLTNTQGDISFFQVKVEEADCQTGQVLSLIHDGAPIPVSLTAHKLVGALNSMVINGTTGYFIDSIWLDRCLKLTCTIGNACGAATDYSYTVFVAARLQDEDLAAREAGPAAYGSISPNPFSHSLHVSLDWPEEETVTVFLSDAGGRIRSHSIKRHCTGKGTEHLQLNTGDLPPGVYAVHAVSEKRMKVWRVIKME